MQAIIGLTFAVLSLVVLNYTVTLLSEETVTRNTRATDDVTLKRVESVGDGSDITPADTSGKETLIADTGDQNIQISNQDLGVGDGDGDSTIMPDQPTTAPTAQPTEVVITVAPTSVPTIAPTVGVTVVPTTVVTIAPTAVPTSVTAPTSAPRSTATPSPTPTPPELVIDDSPNDEIIIKNEDNVLVIKSSDESTELLRVGSTTTVAETLSPTSTVSRSSSSSQGRTSIISRSTAALSRFFTGNQAQEIVQQDTTSTAIALTKTAAPPNSAVNISNTSKNQINSWLERYEIKVWPLGNNQIAIYRNGITTISDFPIKLGVSKQSIKVVLPNEDKQILYYADSVIENLIDQNIASHVPSPEPVYLQVHADNLIYDITTESKQFFLAFVPYSVCKNIEVSALTREIESIRTCSTLDSVMDILSIAL